MTPMKLRICWMYHDFMDLYGDSGNIKVLEKRCHDRNIEIEVDTLSMHEEKDLSAYDIIFLGGGADREQALLMDDLYSRKDNIKQALEQGTFALLICGGYQLFGQYYIAGDGTKINGLGFFDYYTEAGKEKDRCIGNIAIRTQLEGHEILAVGFENHGGQTRNVTHPFGDVLAGLGNNHVDHKEGFYNGQVLATYMHGPLLPKNPEIADFVIYKGLKKNNPNFALEDLAPLDDILEHKAKEVMLKRLQVLS